MTTLLLNQDIYRRVILEEVPRARKFLWIVTADLKDMHVEKGRRHVPFLEILRDLVEEGVAVRLMHAKEPGPRFRADFDRYPVLLESELFERILCPRIHTKGIIIDGILGLCGFPQSHRSRIRSQVSGSPQLRGRIPHRRGRSHPEADGLDRPPLPRRTVPHLSTPRGLPGSDRVVKS